LPVSVARVSFAVHSDVMSSSGAERYYWCLSHQRVESEADMCPGRDRLGPYDSAAEAERAIAKVQERNEAWDAEDERWEGQH
jgi:glycerol-3-phosphate dehydrogenase